MGSVRARLSIMMFLQYFVWGAWGVEMGGYMDQVLHFTGPQIGSIFSTTAIAAMISPLFLGYVADRLFSTERILAVLHLVGAALLGYAATQSEFSHLFPVMIAYALCYMPTLALTNSISFENIRDPEKDFPLIRVFGTLGWIVAGWVVGFVLRARAGSFLYPTVTSIMGAESDFFRANNFLFMAAGASAILGLFCLTLPHTPPKRHASAKDTGDRKSVLSLLREPSFLVFVIASFLVCIPLAFYYSLANVFLGQIDAPFPTALQTIGQISEVGFMALMPWFIVRLGVKKMLALGMLAWAVRYVLFGTLSFPLVLIGLILHGICYDFFFVGSQIYVDSKADVTQRASAQSFIAFVTLGVAMYVGSLLAGYTRDHYPAPVQVAGTTATGESTQTPLPAWDPDAGVGLAKDLELRSDSDLTAEKLPDEFKDETTKVTYSKGALAAALKAADSNDDGRVSRTEWRIAQRNGWFHIWLWPAIAAAGTLVFFWLGFHDKPRTGRG
jgi:nucleoside transporter